MTTITPEKEITVGECLIWLRKLEKLGNDGTKIVHIKNLLSQDRQALIKLIRPKFDSVVINLLIAQTQGDWKPVRESLKALDAVIKAVEEDI